MSRVVEVDIALAILDHQLVDADGLNCGKVDDLEIGGLDGDSPEVVEILVGGNAWRSRGLLGRLAARALGQCRSRSVARGRLDLIGREAEAVRPGPAPEPRRRALGGARRKGARGLMRLSGSSTSRSTASRAAPGPRPRRARRAGRRAASHHRARRGRARHPRAVRRRHPRQRRARARRRFTDTRSSRGTRVVRVESKRVVVRDDAC